MGECWPLDGVSLRGLWPWMCRVRTSLECWQLWCESGHMVLFFMNLGEGICLGQVRPGVSSRSTVGQSHGAWMVCLKLEPNPAQINLSSVSARTYSHPLPLKVRSVKQQHRRHLGTLLETQNLRLPSGPAKSICVHRISRGFIWGALSKQLFGFSHIFSDYQGFLL